MESKTEVIVRPDQMVAIQDFSRETMAGLAQRIESSDGFQQFVWRELELDQIWCRVNDEIEAIQAGNGERMGELAGLQQLSQLLLEAKDVALDGRPLEAAAQLRAAAG
jgi:hypothetical protein